MADIAKDFLVWLIGFGLVGLVALISLHLFLRRLRAKNATSGADGDSQAVNTSPASRFSLANRILVVVIVAGVYIGVLGPLVGNVFAFLNGSVSGESTGQHQVPVELDEQGRPVLVPVPDPISAD